MTNPDYRALCAELVQDIEEWIAAVDHCPPSSSALVQRARAALAQTEPQGHGPTDEELHQLWLELNEFHEGPTSGEVAEIAHTALARWGRPAIEPVPVSERPWERKGWCDADGQCWMGDGGGGGFVPSWRLCKPSDSCLAWSLPHWALPVPNSYSTTPGNQ